MNPENPLFSNPQIDLNALPEIGELVMVPLERDYKTVRYIIGAIAGVSIMIISWGVALFQLGLYPYGYYAAAGFSLLGGWLIIYYGISYEYMGYAVREKDITYKSGWLWKSMVTVPYNRVQHCDVKQGLIDRPFGLSKLTIYTAGGQSTDLEIPGLLPATAEKLKAYILQSTEQSIELE